IHREQPPGSALGHGWLGRGRRLLALPLLPALAGVRIARGPRRPRRTRHQLARQREVALRADRLDVVQHDGLAETRRLREPYVARDGGAVDAVAEVLLGLVRDLAREVQPLVEHGQQHTVYLQARIDITL